MYPALYDAQHAPYIEDLPFWLSLADKRRSLPCLELGCGAGRVLLALARAGHTVIGLDNNAEMLSFLSPRIEPALSERALILQADLTSFRLGVQCGLIILPCNTYSTLTSHQRRSALARVSEHLAPGGLFAVSLPNPFLIEDLPEYGEEEIEEIFPHPNDGEPVQLSSAWQRDGTRFILDWHYDHIISTGETSRFSVRTQHDFETPEIYTAEFSQAGLTDIQLFGNFERAPFSRETPYLMILASASL